MINIIESSFLDFPINVWDGDFNHDPVLYTCPAFSKEECEAMPSLHPLHELPNRLLKVVWGGTKSNPVLHFLPVEAMVAIQPKPPPSPLLTCVSQVSEELILLSISGKFLYRYRSFNYSYTQDDNNDKDDLLNFAVANLIYQYKSINTIVPNVDNHYITCFKGEVNVVAYKFIQDAVYGYALIIQGIFPIVNDSQGKIGKTEELVL